MTSKAQVLQAIRANPGLTPAQLAALLPGIPAGSVSGYCTMLSKEGSVTRKYGARAWCYTAAGHRPAKTPRPRARPRPPVEMARARAAFEAATAGVAHTKDALETAWASFMALADVDRRAFRRALENYELLAVRFPAPARARPVPVLPGSATPYKSAVATVARKSTRSEIEDRAEERRISKLDEIPQVAARRRAESPRMERIS
jgi:hypothetical protein